MSHRPLPLRRSIAAILCALLYFTLTTAVLSAAAADETTPNATISNETNFNCPADCHCTLAHNTHKPLLHAKCSSITYLRSDTPLRATLPIHSIDLSYLGLPRLSHSLEKLRDLTSVDLSHNELHEIGHLGRRIKKLNLKHNRITSAKLAKLPQHVQVLNLQHNDITYLPLEFTKLSQLQTLELSHNLINCSCETLEVRNWLQERHVFMEHPITCTYPAEVKGKPWLQVKQSDICDKEKRGWYADAVVEENELMLGDQPIEGSAAHDEDEDELGNAFMPIDKKTTAKYSDQQQFQNVEGSGDLSELNLPVELMTTEGPAMLMARRLDERTTVASDPNEAEDEEDGSGSGGGMLFIPHLHSGPTVLDDFDQPDSQQNADDDYDHKPIPEPTPSSDIFGNGMGIFDDDDVAPRTAIEDEIVPVLHHDVQAPPVNVGDPTTEGVPASIEAATNEAELMKANMANKDDSNATYFLLGIIILIVVGLIFYVGIKRCKNKRNAAHDAENQRATELLDMDKKQLGKPVHRNGNGTEHAPLIGEKSKADLAKPFNGAGKKPYDANDVKDGPATQQPLLNGSGNGAPANANGTPADAIHQPIEVPTIAEPLSSAPHQYYPITPRYPPPKSPRASKYGQGEMNNNNDDDVFLPSSPKSGRYSPVYSPETGRVKIKLTETPKPKTPMLVTRSKSNAGDIITTPVVAAHINAAPGVHVGGGVGANGHIDH